VCAECSAILVEYSQMAEAIVRSSNYRYHRYRHTHKHNGCMNLAVVEEFLLT
jgi:hypothetical protein